MLLASHCTVTVDVAGSMDIHCSHNQRISLITWIPQVKIGLQVFENG